MQFLRIDRAIAVALLASVGSAFAAMPTVNAIAVPEGASAPSSPSEATVRVYDNWTNPPSALTGLFFSGSDEIADDLTLAAGSSTGRLTNMGVNIANVGGASALTGGQIAIGFYDLPGGAFINGFFANLPALNLLAGQSSRLSFGAGALTSLGVDIPSTGVRVSLQWIDATFTEFGGIGDLGFQTRGPIGVGSSTDSLLNLTTNTPFNFLGGPLANTGIFLDTDAALVPEPAGLSILAMSALGLVIRRRK